MDIKLKNNKDIEDMNDSRNNSINENKKNIKKNRGIIATALAILIIVSAAIGMCASYKTIDKYAKGMKENYFNQWRIGQIIGQTSYSLYYNSIIEKDNQRPDEVLLDIKKNSQNYNQGDYGYAEDYLNSNINDFNSSIYHWNGTTQGNLKFYYYNTSNKKTNTNLNETISFENNNINLSKFNKELYQFYAVVNFDSNGNITIGDVVGADKDILKNNIENAIWNINDNYNESFEDEIGIYSMTVKPIKDMTIVYAVPKVLQ